MPSHDTEQRKLAAIMFTDMVGYSALTQRNEALALALLHEQQQLVRPIFAQHSGREVKGTGDGFLVEFASALQAVRCAIEIQKGMVRRNSSEAPDRRIQIRIGLHLGDVETRDGDVFGDGVNIAARIEPLAEAGGICITGPVFDQVHNKIDQPLERLRQPELKNIQAAIDVYRVVLPWQRGAAAVRAGSQRRRQLLLAVLALGVVGGATWWLYRLSSAARTTPARAVGQAEVGKSIAVLPFTNMSPDHGDEYLSDGVTEEIIGALSKISGLHVAARTSSFAFKGKNEAIEDIGRQLHVGNVLEGSVTKAGTKLRITAQLINVADGYHLWSETYDREMPDIFAIRSDIAQRVADRLKVTLLANEKHGVEKPATDNLEAYNLYLQGRYYASKATQEGFNKAIGYLRHAIDLDPRYALAYNGLAYYYLWASDFTLPPNDAMPKAREAATRALDIDPRLGEAHAFLAFISFHYDNNWPVAEREYRRAIELTPSGPWAHSFYGGSLIFVGRVDEGLAECRRAIELDPLSAETSANLGNNLYFARRYEQAIDQLRETVAMQPDYWLAHEYLGLAYTQTGRVGEAIGELERSRQLEADNPEIAGVLGFAYALAGQRDAAQQILAEWIERSSRQYVSGYDFAIIYAALGDTDQAFAWLHKTVEQRSIYRGWLRVDPVVDSLRADPRFTELLKTVGLDK